MAVKKPKPYNSGQWTEARMRSFVMSALRRASWPVKYDAVKAVYVGPGINPATGRKCKLHQCRSCEQQFPAGDMQADHREPVIPVDGLWGDTTEWLGYNWNELLPRLFSELEGYDALCSGCHKKKSDGEQAQRRANKKV